MRRSRVVSELSEFKLDVDERDKYVWATAPHHHVQAAVVVGLKRNGIESASLAATSFNDSP